MKSEAGALAIERLMRQYGCLPHLNDSTTVKSFDKIELASAIEAEINKSIDYGFTKITLHMDLPDARLLANVLRGS